LECWFGFGNREFQVEGEEIIERVGGIGAWAKVREDNHIPEVPKGTSVLIIVLPRVSGAKAALTLGYFYDAATRHARLCQNWRSLFCVICCKTYIKASTFSSRGFVLS
jgi:hypothetical protein